MTLIQFARAKFSNALSDYEAALASKDSSRIVAASLKVHFSCTSRRDRAAINRVFKAQNTSTP